MSIVSCSLGCTASSSVGNQFSCGVTDVFVNQEIRVTFNKPVNIGSASNNSFQVVENSTGKTPPGTFSIDPTDSSVLVYRPQLTFDSSGNPTFGLTEDETYTIKIPGSDLDALGPYISSTQGQANASRLECTLVSSRGIFDANPGAPIAVSTVDVVDPVGGGILTGLPAQGAANVSTGTNVTIVFNDIMNPATLANPVTGTSDSIRVKIDPDGNTTDPSDQVPVEGSFTLTVDQNALRTTVVFNPSGGFPSAGTGPSPRRVVVSLASTIADLGGNALVNSGNITFTTEVIPFALLDLREDFLVTTAEDSVRTGSVWGSGTLGVGPGGGSGQLGDLVVPSGTTVVLNTDSEDFSAPAFQDPSIFNFTNVVDIVDPMTFTVDGGVFEFSRIRVDAGGTLQAVGSNPARLYVRGEVIVQGKVVMSGGSALIHDATELLGGVGGEPGAAGGAGGTGGLRPDGLNFPGEGGVENPDAMGEPMDAFDPADYVLFNGSDGGGISFPNTLAPTDNVGEGRGGLGWPQPGALAAPNDMVHFPVDPMDTMAFPWDPLFDCRIGAPGGSGAGGANAFSGADGFTDSTPGGAIPPEAAGGDAADLGIDDTVKSLDPEQGLLRGGAGGGGAGSHLFSSGVNGTVAVDCLTPVGGGALAVTDFRAQSSAAGGAGGAGVQVQAGRRLVLNGTVDASGGDGGSGLLVDTGGGIDFISQPGGAGAGGSILLQSPIVQIQAVPSRINVRGGVGGQGAGGLTSTGGFGSPGFVRLETPAPAPSTILEASKIVPLLSEVQGIYGPSSSLDDFFTSAVWDPPAMGASGRSGAQSCWFQPEGNYFRLIFQSDNDDDMNGVIEGDELGWDMGLNVTLSPNTQSYRGPNDITGNTPLEQSLGNDLGSAPVVVRFQGARALGSLVDPCNVPLAGVNSLIVPGSLTEWVKHPDELNNFHNNASLTPNIFRFTIIWDREQDPTEVQLGAESVNVRVTPD